MAYRYLARTIQAFPQARAFCKLMEEAGFTSVKAHPLTLGIVTIYQGEK
jgi:demethylmenaquinone methyltransferase/2-methoxy-6-polyprenyl-1,4-benzoquinol methylase